MALALGVLKAGQNDAGRLWSENKPVRIRFQLDEELDHESSE